MKNSKKRLRKWMATVLIVVCAVWLAWAASADRRGKWLRQAAWTNNFSKVKLFVWFGTDANYSTGGASALHGAAYHGNVEMIDFLLKHGAAVDQREKFDITPLWWARQNGQSEAEQLLIGRGANPDTSHIAPP